MMIAAKDHPGIYVPPPLIYLGVFLAATLCQRVLPLDAHFFETTAARMLGIGFVVVAVIFGAPAIGQFVKSRNTLITVKPAHSLQTSGIYSITRNPMYLSLLLLYTGLALWWGNWWTLIFLPVLLLIMTRFVIRFEERYLERAFGESYRAYKKKVRRWI